MRKSVKKESIPVHIVSLVK